MKKLLVITALIVASLYGCNKTDIAYPPPSIKFITNDGFINNDTVLRIGETFKVGIEASNQDVNLTNFIIKAISDTTETFLDSGMNTPTLKYEKALSAGLVTQKWVFIIRDRDRKSAEVSLTITIDSTSGYGNINYIPSIELGAQNNTMGSFYSLFTDSIYSLKLAFYNQNNIDLCYFYDLVETDESTIASPGANIEASVFPGDYGLQNWTTLRTTRFKKANITTEDFLNATNDSLLLAAYGQADGNRKAKNLQSNIMYSFKNENGKVGIFKVNEISGSDSGAINISIKVQW